MDSMIIHNKKDFMHSWKPTTPTIRCSQPLVSDKVILQQCSPIVRPNTSRLPKNTPNRWTTRYSQQPSIKDSVTMPIFKKTTRRHFTFSGKAPLTHNDVYDYNKWYLISYIFESMDQLDSAKYYLNKVKPLDFTAINYYSLWLRISEREKNYSKSIYFAKNWLQQKRLGLRLQVKKQLCRSRKNIITKIWRFANNNLIIKNKQKEL